MLIIVSLLPLAYALRSKLTMANSPTLDALKFRFTKSKSPTALDVINEYGQGKYLKGKTAIVTGGNSGIGLETCKALAHAGCKVILCSRSIDAGINAVNTEIKNSGLGNYIVDDADTSIVVKELDLNSFDSIKKFVDNILVEYKTIDYLVLNAGIMAVNQLERTVEGFEKQIGVNHFGHAYLTSLLLPTLEQTTTPIRIVSVASVAHTFGGGILPLTDLNYKTRKYSPWEAYGTSKLANILFAKGVVKNVKNRLITAVSVHPGVIKSNLWNRNTGLLNILFQVIGSAIADKTVPQGAACQVYACVSPRILDDDMRGVYLNDNQPDRPTKSAEDEDNVSNLWTETYKQINEANKKL